jgi:hypothetical protein
MKTLLLNTIVHGSLEIGRERNSRRLGQGGNDRCQEEA